LAAQQREPDSTPTGSAAPEAGAYTVHPLVRHTDLAGIFVFAVQGALAALAAHLDLFGVLVLSFVTALGGGMVRDVLMGALPPSALRGWSYPSTAFAAGIIVFALGHYLPVPHELLQTLDAGGLALFTVAGTEKALDARIHPLSAILLGTITAIGGGTMRDVLLNHVPAILRVDVYATAALFGAIVLVLTRRLGLTPTLAAVMGAVVCFVLRMIGLWLHWRLPGLAATG
jgi:uncharacterized membrane protein YeiH